MPEKAERPSEAWPSPGPHHAATDVQEGAVGCKQHDSRLGRLAGCLIKEQSEAARWPSLRLQAFKIGSNLGQKGLQHSPCWPLPATNRQAAN
jgi:hypothetical protein